MSTTTNTYCAKHPKEETGVTCSACGISICPKCMVYTPVGIKCRACGLSKGGTLFEIKPARLILAVITSLAAGAFAAFVGSLGLGFLLIFGAMAYGYFCGSLILKASGMKRGIRMEIITGAGMVIGALLFLLIPPLAAGKLLPVVLLRILRDPFLVLAITISSACAVSKIRYM